MTDWQKQIFQNIDTLIKAGQISITAIIPTNKDEKPYAFTIGLTELYDHPEIFICGLEKEATQAVLLLAFKAIQSGRRFHANQVIENVASVTMLACGLDVSQLAPADSLIRIRYGDEFEAIQLLWPDRHGKFPSDPDCIPVVSRVQLECLPKGSLKPFSAPVRH